MAKRKVIRTRFNGGVHSPKLSGLIDFDGYVKGCRTADNFIAMPEGGMFKRRGFYYQAETKTSAKLSRLLPFIFSDDDAYILEFGDEYMRVYRGWGQVQDGQSAYEIATPYDETELAALQYAQDADVMYQTHPDYQQRKLSRTGHTSWTMAAVEMARGPFLQENDGDTTITVDGYTIDAVDTGAETFTITGDGDLSAMFPDGSTFEVTGSTGNDGEWTVASTNDADPFVITVTGNITDATADGTAIPDITEDGVVELTASASLFDSDHEGALWQLTDQPTMEVETGSSLGLAATVGPVTVHIGQALDYKTTGNCQGVLELQRSYDSGTTWEMIDQLVRYDNSDGNIEDAYTEELDTCQIRWYKSAHQAGGTHRAYLMTKPVWAKGVVRIDTVNSATSAQATVTSKLAKGNAATKKWSEGAWSDYRGWSKCVTFFEQRLFFANTAHQPTTIWWSASYAGGDFENFLDGTDDDDAGARTIAASQDPIQWIAGDRSLLAGTSGGCYILRGTSDNEPLTPTNAKASIQDIVGSASIMPVHTSLGLLFVERGTKRIAELAYSWESDKFMTANMTRLAEHITGSGVKEIAFQVRPERIMWAVTDDGDLVALTYLRAENVIAASNITTTGSFESIAIKPGKTSTGNADEDELWAIINRTINGATVRNVERMMPWNFDDQEDGVFVDSAVTYDSTATTTPGKLWDHLEGETVQICGDGGVQASKTISVGIISGGLDHAASVIHAGLGYTATLVPNRVYEGALALGSIMRPVKLAVTFYETNYCKFGPSATDLDTIAFRDASDATDTAVPLFTDTKVLDFPAGYERNGDIYFVSDVPLPCTILSLAMTVETE